MEYAHARWHRRNRAANKAARLAHRARIICITRITSRAGIALHLFVIALFTLVANGAYAQGVEKQVRLASLEWLPYVGQALPQQGLSGRIASTVLQKAGYQLKIDYFPWKRAMQLGGRDANYIGYFPAYYTRERAQECHFSKPMGTSTIGLAYLKNAPLQWETVDDLVLQSKLAIGVVYGYSNGAAFDDLVKQGRLKVDPSSSDAQNLRKLLLGRVRAAVVDDAVLRYLLRTDPNLQAQASLIAFHPRPLAELKLFICFQLTAQGLEMKNAFDQALQDTPMRKLEEEYFQLLESSNGKNVAGSVSSSASSTSSSASSAGK